MTNLERLVQKLCPDGVEYRTLSELFQTRNGYTPSKANKEFWENGTVPWFRMEDIRENGRILASATQMVSRNAVKGDLFPANSIIVATSATIGEHALITVPSLANQRFTYLVLKTEYQHLFDIKFLYYYCFKLDQYCKECLNQGNFASVDMKKFAKFRFPVPPLPVQSEIVKILDNFTELTARKKPYDYYCKQVFQNTSAKIFIPIRDLGEWTGGCTPSMSKSAYWENGTIPWISSKDMKSATLTDTQNHITQKAIDETSAKLLPSDTVAIVARSGILKHTLPVAYIPFETTINQDIKALVVNERVLPCYAYFVIYTYRKEILKKTKKQGGTVDSLDVNAFMNYKIPLLPIEEQQRIVSALDRFNTLCNDLTSGLPAEIKARQTQYEYYQDKLLTFRELTT